MRATCRALPILAVAVPPAPTFAQSLVCHPIRRGESAEQAARRVTGDSRNAYSASFHIMNGASKFVPKSQYDRLGAGWRACTVRPAPRRNASPPRQSVPPAVLAASEPVTGARIEPAPLPAAATIATAEPLIRFRVSAQPAAPPSPRPIGHLYMTIVWLGTAIGVPWFGVRVVNGFMTRRKTAFVLAQHFAHRFIAEFERPLVLTAGEAPPLKSRLRRVRGGRFDILLAPGEGRRYPNLTDHKRNVEYDVDRVLSALDDPAFVSGALYTQAEWVVVPFEPRTSPKQAGVTCISSF